MYINICAGTSENIYQSLQSKDLDQIIVHVLSINGVSIN